MQNTPPNIPPQGAPQPQQHQQQQYQQQYNAPQGFYEKPTTGDPYKKLLLLVAIMVGAECLSELIGLGRYIFGMDFFYNPIMRIFTTLIGIGVWVIPIIIGARMKGNILGVLAIIGSSIIILIRVYWMFSYSPFDF